MKLEMRQTKKKKKLQQNKTEQEMKSGKETVKKEKLK